MSSSRYPNLFSPIKIRGKVFKNRIMVSPMGAPEPPGEEPGIMTREGLKFYKTIAEGGSGRICTGENDVVFGSAVFGKYHFFKEEMTPLFISRMREYVDLCHANGALAFTSFDHMGVYARVASKKAPPPPSDGERHAGPPPVYKKDGTQYTLPDKAYGPSELTINEPYDGITSRKLENDNENGKHVYEMSEAQMNEIADAFALCARNAKACGLDGMVIHAGHGFLFSQWISSRFNKRTDKYGGSMENRARFPIMCLQRIREAVGDDFLIEMRFSAEENIAPICDRDFIPDTVTIDETVEFFKVLDQHPGLLDIAHITGGLHTVPVYNIRTTANSYFPMGLNVKGAAAVKAAVKNIKVGVVGSLSDPDLCEQIIAEGKADFVIMARQLLIADPEFPKKAESDHPELINNCLRCVVCRANGHCSVNPVDVMAGKDDPLWLEPVQNPKKVAVIGGGIGGMKAAEYASQSGHKVTLYEQTESLGGILKYTDYDDFKLDIRHFKDNMRLRLQDDPRVEIRLNTRVCPEDIQAGGYDAAVVAIGGTPISLPVPGGDSGFVMDAVTAYCNPEKVGTRVVVIGGGLTGCEAAIHWASLGRKVTLISRSAELMRKVKPRNPADGSTDTHLIMLYQYKVDIRKGTACTAIRGKEVYFSGCGGEEKIYADTVINASGIRPDKEQADAFRTCAPEVYIIGDAESAGMIGDAVLAARQAVVNFNHLF